jgi:hypothetical protein
VIHFLSSGCDVNFFFIQLKCDIAIIVNIHSMMIFGFLKNFLNDWKITIAKKKLHDHWRCD